jgi:hypothetical protein
MDDILVLSEAITALSGGDSKKKKGYSFLCSEFRFLMPYSNFWAFQNLPIPDQVSSLTRKRVSYRNMHFWGMGFLSFTIQYLKKWDSKNSKRNRTFQHGKFRYLRF